MTIDDVKAELARGQAEVMRMLDEWCSRRGGRQVTLARDYASRTFRVVLWCGAVGHRQYNGDSPEAARANAAEAIRGE